MISDMTISKIMRDEKLPYVQHGFRTGLRTWAAEKQPFIPEPVAESALSHVIPDAVIKAYAIRRGNLHDVCPALSALRT